MRRLLLLAALLFTATLPAQASTVNLITNGDFESGNTGFTSDLAVNQNIAGGYTITDTPKSFNSNFAAFGDNTTGDGNMMLINGAQNTSTVAWEQTVTVEAGTDYDLMTSIALAFPGAVAVDVVVNDVVLGSISPSTVQGEWVDFSFDWNSGTATTATIQFIGTTTSFGGNDYALDDIGFFSMAVVPLPASALMLLSALAGVAGLRRRRSAAAA